MWGLLGRQKRTAMAAAHPKTRLAKEGAKKRVHITRKIVGTVDGKLCTL